MNVLHIQLMNKNTALVPPELQSPILKSIVFEKTIVRVL